MHIYDNSVRTSCVTISFPNPLSLSLSHTHTSIFLWLRSSFVGCLYGFPIQKKPFPYHLIPRVSDPIRKSHMPLTITSPPSLFLSHTYTHTIALSISLYLGRWQNNKVKRSFFQFHLYFESDVMSGFLHTVSHAMEHFFIINYVTL